MGFDFLKDLVGKVMHRKNKGKKRVSMAWKNPEFWDDVEELTSDNLIEEFEQTFGYTFPADFKEIFPLINGGYPEHPIFDTSCEPERDISNFDSFNKDSDTSIWDSYGAWDETCEEFKGFTERYIPFAYSGGGDAICFDTKNDHIVYVDHELARVEYVADTFTEFLCSLYMPEDY